MIGFGSSHDTEQLSKDELGKFPQVFERVEERLNEESCDVCGEGYELAQDGHEARTDVNYFEGSVKVVCENGHSEKLELHK